VPGREDRRGRVGRAQHGDRGALGRGRVAQVVRHRAGPAAERPQVTAMPVPRRRQPAQVSQVRDPPVPLCDQMPGGGGRPGHVGRHDHVPGHARRPAINKDHRTDKSG